MEQMYDRLYQFPGGLFCPDAPVFVKDGAVLQHKQEGGLYARLQIKNMSGKTIEAVTAKLFPFAISGALLGEGMETVYQAGQAAPGAVFGQDQLTLLPAESCAFAVCVLQVQFADGSCWNATELGAWHVAPEGYGE